MELMIFIDTITGRNRLYDHLLTLSIAIWSAFTIDITRMLPNVSGKP